MTVVECPSDWAGLTDGELVISARDGRDGAFAELYRRHAGSAWRVAMAVASNEADAADVTSEAFTRVLARGGPDDPAKFRPYLLRVVRNTALTVRRRRGRDQRLEDVPEVASASAGPAAEMVAGINAAMVRTAFASLPERWRLTLWLTEVEQLPPREAAGVLEISANALSQLAIRARVGLRDRYLQAHLATTEVPATCRSTVDQLGAYTVGTLGARDRTRVASHLEGCAPCRDRLAELDAVRRHLPVLLPVLPAGLAGTALRRWSGGRWNGGGPIPDQGIGQSVIGACQHLAQLPITPAIQVPLAAAAANAGPATVAAASVAVAALLAVGSTVSGLGGGGATTPAPAVPVATATSSQPASTAAQPAQTPSLPSTRPSSPTQPPGAAALATVQLSSGGKPAAAAPQGSALAALAARFAKVFLTGSPGTHAGTDQKVSTQTSNMTGKSSLRIVPGTSVGSKIPVTGSGVTVQMVPLPSQPVTKPKSPKPTLPKSTPPGPKSPKPKPPIHRAGDPTGQAAKGHPKAK